MHAHEFAVIPEAAYATIDIVIIGHTFDWYIEILFTVRPTTSKFGL